MVKGGRKLLWSPGNTSRPRLRREEGWSLAREVAPSARPGVAQEPRFWGTASCGNQAHRPSVPCLGLLTPGACLSLHTTLPAFCLHSLRKAFTLAATATREAEVELPSRDIYHLHPMVPLQGHRTARLGPCLSHAASVSWCIGHANCSSNTAERLTREPVKIPCLSKGLAVTLGARGRTWGQNLKGQWRGQVGGGIWEGCKGQQQSGGVDGHLAGKARRWERLSTQRAWGPDSSNEQGRNRSCSARWQAGNRTEGGTRCPAGSWPEGT